MPRLKLIPFQLRRMCVAAKRPIMIQAMAVSSYVSVPSVSRFAHYSPATRNGIDIFVYFLLPSAFGLGTMIYVGLEIGSFFEIPFTSPCHEILRGVNPLLQMIFTFMQMYFIFMNARVSVIALVKVVVLTQLIWNSVSVLQLNIHRFKVIARFGLMHVCATNICVWIRTLVLESLKEITLYYQHRAPNSDDGAILDSIRQHALRHSGQVLGTHSGPIPEWEPIDLNVRGNLHTDSNEYLPRIVQSTVRTAAKAVSRGAGPYIPESTTEAWPTESSTPTASNFADSMMVRKLKKFITSTTIASTYPSTTPTPAPQTASSLLQTTTARLPSTTLDAIATTISASTSNPAQESVVNNIFSGVENVYQTMSGLSHNDTQPQPQERTFESLDALFPQALTQSISQKYMNCGRVNIMGTIVNDSAPYLYPFIIEYSLIGAVVIYVMWKHIGRYPKSAAEDLEHRLEVMLSRRAVAMAQKAQSGRVDCVGASKGLFFGLLMLVGSLICLILFFVLIRHPQFSLYAIYLADGSHCVIMGLSILAILIGFCR